MRQIQRRLEKLAKSLAVKPIPTPPIIQMALQLTPSEDLMILRRIIKAGRPLLASTEQESRALAAYQSVVEKATGVMNDNLTQRINPSTGSIAFSGVNKDPHLNGSVYPEG
jgi:hypothetical protein